MDPNESESTRKLPLRLAAGVAALLLLGGVIVVGVVVAASSNGSSASAVATAVPGAGTFPAPPRGAVVLARQDGGDALALALRAAGGRLELQASVVGRQGTGVRGLSVGFGVQPGPTERFPAKACGAGCYRASAPLPSRPRVVTVEVTRGSKKTVWRVPLQTWPPKDASALVTRAAGVWRNLRSFEFAEQLASDADGGVQTHWKVVAPDRLSYEIAASGAAAVIIGDQRWDRQGGQWRKSQQTPLDLPQPTWGRRVTNAYVLGQGRVEGVPVTRVSFYDPNGRAWFEVRLEKRTQRARELRMTTTAHFMHHSYSRFNAPIVIEPPVADG